VQPLPAAGLPRTFELAQNFPNPFNPQTTIKYQLPKDADVSLKIFNIQGQLVKKAVDAKQRAGFYSINWDGTDMHGHKVASGVFFYVLQTEDFKASKKMVILQ
jgi:flagellar hook assembly protein FlgD